MSKGPAGMNDYKLKALNNKTYIISSIGLCENAFTS